MRVIDYLRSFRQSAGSPGGTQPEMSVDYRCTRYSCEPIPLIKIDAEFSSGVKVSDHGERFALVDSGADITRFPVNLLGELGILDDPDDYIIFDTNYTPGEKQHNITEPCWHVKICLDGEWLPNCVTVLGAAGSYPFPLIGQSVLKHYFLRLDAPNFRGRLANSPCCSL